MKTYVKMANYFNCFVAGRRNSCYNNCMCTPRPVRWDFFKKQGLICVFFAYTRPFALNH